MHRDFIDIRLIRTQTLLSKRSSLSLITNSIMATIRKMSSELILICLLGYAVLHSAVAPAPCNPSDFKCTNGNCIERSWFCDEIDDCGDNSDERYCNKIRQEACPPGWFKCPTGLKCIPWGWMCDGRNDCGGVISDELFCVKNKTDGQDSDIPNVQGRSLTNVQGVTAMKRELKSWLLRTRKSGSRADRWGSQIHRIAVSLHFADNSTFGPENRTGEEIRYEFTIQLLHRLSKDKKISSHELALYIHALLVACMEPRDFYGYDLVRELRSRVEKDGNYTNPFLILALCNAGDVMTTKDVERVTTAYDSQYRPFWTDFQALASMALACISSHSDVPADERTLKDMLQELKRRQFKNGTVDSYRTTALVTQALFIHDSYKKDFDLDSAIRVLVSGLNSSRSLLNAYYVLPVLHQKSLLNVSSTHCGRQSIAEDEALGKTLDVSGETTNVLYSVWLGDERNLARTWRLKMRENSTIYDVIETVAKIDNRQRVEYNVVDGKPYVAAVNGKVDDPEMGTFWFIFLKKTNSDEDPKMIEESPVDIKLKPNQEVILWYKRGPWSDQSLIEKSVTSS